MRRSVSSPGERDRGDFVLAVPHQALLKPPPGPPTALPRRSPPAARHQETQSSFIYSSQSPGNYADSLPGVMRQFSKDLRQCHRTKVFWPTGHAQLVGNHAEQFHVYHTDILVGPVLDLLSQLRASFIKEPLRLISRNPEDGVSVITVTSIFPPILDAPSVSAGTPTILFMPSGTLARGPNNGFDCSQTLEKYLRDAWESDASAKVLCCDLQELFILQKDPASPHTVICERVSVDPSLVTIRVVVAAYIYTALPTGPFHSAYLAFPRTTKAFDPPIVLGCLPDPSTPMPTDEAVFITHKRRSDFDLYVLKNVPARALQALRWQDYTFTDVEQGKMLSPGAELSATTNGFTRDNATLHPHWPVDLEAIPESVLKRIETIRRSPPLDETSRVRLLESTQFRIGIVGKLGNEHNAVYKCEVISIDGNTAHHGLPSLCVKLLDDRLAKLHAPSDPGDDDVVFDAPWWYHWRTAEDFARHEHAVYQQLAFAQGAMIPWYYGAHKFVLPGGHWVYGLLLEYVPEGLEVTEAISVLNDTERCTLLQSARHAVRVLQYGDVSQHDWHKGQILVRCSPVPHIVLVDFAWASISVEPEHHQTDDYGSMLTIFDKPLRSVGMSAESILGHYGAREVWDVGALCSWQDDNGKWQLLASEDPFAWIYRR